MVLATTFFAVKVICVEAESAGVDAAFSESQAAVAPPVRFGKSTTSDGIGKFIALLANAEYWSTSRRMVVLRMSGTKGAPVAAPVLPIARDSTPCSMHQLRASAEPSPLRM